MYKIINYAFSKRNVYFISNPSTFFIETYHNYRLFTINENTNLHKGVGAFVFLSNGFKDFHLSSVLGKKQKTKSSQYRG